MSETELLDQQKPVVDTIMQLALKDNVDIQVLSALVDMQDRILNRNAESEFNSDFVQCQAKMPNILKDADNDNTKSSYARLETINKHAIPIMNKHNFALSFSTTESPMHTPEDKHVRVVAQLIHSRGHVKEYFYDSPYDDLGLKGNKNKTQVHARASAVTYGERYLTCMIWNIVVMEDDDGNAANSPAQQTMTDDQLKEIRDDLSVFPDPAKEERNLCLQLWDLARLEDVPSEGFNRAVVAVKNKADKLGYKKPEDDG